MQGIYRDIATKVKASPVLLDADRKVAYAQRI
jgi:hypothetical protein